MHEDLNEWVALDQPGHYSLYVTSGRVTRRDATKSEPVELRSNSLEFDVVAANPAWQQQTLGSATATLNMESSTAERRMLLFEPCVSWIPQRPCGSSFTFLAPTQMAVGTR